MTEKVKAITENTVLPLSLIITIAGGIFWLSTVYARGEATAAAVDHMGTTLESIDRRLSRIEGAVQPHVVQEESK